MKFIFQGLVDVDWSVVEITGGLFHVVRVCSDEFPVHQKFVIREGRKILTICDNAVDI